MRPRLGVAFAVCVMGAAVLLAAQASFDVASVRRSPARTPAGSSSRMQPGGSYVATNMTVQQLIAAAYGVPIARVFDGADWVSTDRYDIVAKAAGNPTTEETGWLLQTLLRERFRLSARQEQRVLPVYALTMARPGGTNGPRLWRSEVDCTDRRGPINTSDLTARSVCGIPLLVSKGISFFVAGDIPMSTVAQALSGAAGRPVLDRTGLTGRYDISVDWASSPDVDSISVFTAVQEQLGLRLESTTAPLDVVVIERVERPTEN